MSKLPFKATVAELTGQIDRVVSALGGSGTDLYERAGSLQAQLEEYEFRQLRFVAGVRREYAARPGYKFTGNPEQFAETCRWIIARLEAYLEAHEKTAREARPAAPRPLEPATPEAGTGPGRGIPPAAIWIGAGVGAVSLLVLPFFCVLSVEITEWPSGRTYVEERTHWSIVVFWALVGAAVTVQSLRLLSRRK